MKDDLRAAPAGLPPKSGDLLRHVLIDDQADRDEVCCRLRRHRDAGARDGYVPLACTIPRRPETMES